MPDRDSRARLRYERAWEIVALADNPSDGRLIQLSEAQGWRCCWCGEAMTWAPGPRMATREHATPRCEGGSDEWLNLAAACLFCNNRRHHPNTPASAKAPRGRRVLIE